MSQVLPVAGKPNPVAAYEKIRNMNMDQIKNLPRTKLDFEVSVFRNSVQKHYFSILHLFDLLDLRIAIDQATYLLIKAARTKNLPYNNFSITVAYQFVKGFTKGSDGNKREWAYVEYLPAPDDKELYFNIMLDNNQIKLLQKLGHFSKAVERGEVKEDDDSIGLAQSQVVDK